MSEIFDVQRILSEEQTRVKLSRLCQEFCEFQRLVQFIPTLTEVIRLAMQDDSPHNQDQARGGREFSISLDRDGDTVLSPYITDTFI